MNKLTRFNQRLMSRWRALLLAMMALTSLACMTFEMNVKVTHKKGQDDRVTLVLSERLTDQYVEAARRANAEREADYAAADMGEPSAHFPETWQEVEGAGDLPEQLRKQGLQVVENSRGFTATSDRTLTEHMQKQAESGTELLKIDREHPKGTLYTFEIDLPEIETMPEELDKLRREGPGPKPPLEPIDPDKIAEEQGGMAGVIAEGLKMAGLEGTELDEWYAKRVLLEAGFPEIRYVVELPGEIETHEVNDRPAGQVEGNRVTLVIDEAFIREFGPGVHHFRVESVLNLCHETCSEHPHMIWDGRSDYPECECICEKGLEMREEGCISCEDVCKKRDPPAQYDPENSEPNRCACREPADQEEAAVEATVTPTPGSKKPIVPATTSSLVQDLEKFLAGRGKGPSAGQAAAGAAGVSILITMWALTKYASGVSKEDLDKAVAEWQRRQGTPGAPVPGGAEAPQAAPAAPGAEAKPPEADWATFRERSLVEHLEARQKVSEIQKIIRGLERAHQRLKVEYDTARKTAVCEGVIEIADLTMSVVCKSPKSAGPVLDALISYGKAWTKGAFKKLLGETARVTSGGELEGDVTEKIANLFIDPLGGSTAELPGMPRNTQVLAPRGGLSKHVIVKYLNQYGLDGRAPQAGQPTLGRAYDVYESVYSISKVFIDGSQKCEQLRLRMNNTLQLKLAFERELQDAQMQLDVAKSGLGWK
jgi:hypothetical protein